LVTRNTARRDRYRSIIRDGEPPCHICHQPIDYQAPHLDPLAFTIDHLTPLNAGGADVLDNLGPAHRKCNRDKADTVQLDDGVTFITTRSW
jgi:5-methylcytosine-specific restriction endonuclease McrA